MKISLRLILSLVSIIMLVVSLFTLYQVRHEKRVLIDELDRRAGVLAEGLQESIESHLANAKFKEIERIVEKFGNRERLAGIAIYDQEFKPLAVTKSLAEYLTHPPYGLNSVFASASPQGRLQDPGQPPRDGTQHQDPRRNGTRRRSHLQKVPHLQKGLRPAGCFVAFFNTETQRHRDTEAFRDGGVSFNLPTKRVITTLHPTQETFAKWLN